MIQPVNDGFFSLIVAGSKHYDGVEWLDSARMDAVLEQLKSRFDIVLVDGPPYIVADASILGSKVDGVLAVVRPGVTKREAASNMAEQIGRSHATLLGVTLIEIPNWGSTYFAKIPNNRYYTA